MRSALGRIAQNSAEQPNPQHDYVAETDEGYSAEAPAYEACPEVIRSISILKDTSPEDFASG